MKMNYKFLSVLFIISMILLPMVAATTLAEDVKAFVDGTINVAKPIFNALVGSTMVNTGNGAIATLMLLLVILVVYALLGSVNLFGSNKWINGGISIIIATLGIRFLPPNLIETAIVPSSAFVALIVAGLPMLLLLIITSKNEQIKPYGTQIWYAYSIIMLGILINNYAKEAPKQVITSLAIAAIVGIILAVMWRKITSLTESVKEKTALSQTANDEIKELNTKIAKIQEEVSKGVRSNTDARKRIHELNEGIKFLEEQRSK